MADVKHITAAAPSDLHESTCYQLGLVSAILEAQASALSGCETHQSLKVGTIAGVIGAALTLLGTTARSLVTPTPSTPFAVSNQLVVQLQSILELLAARLEIQIGAHGPDSAPFDQEKLASCFWAAKGLCQKIQDHSMRAIGF
jgi:hypothetical protein